MKYELSVCIPTYNRGQYIGETIESVISQVDDNNPVQIVISDNASQDNTKEIIENYQKQYSHIKYFCFDENMGADRNFLNVVEIADGDYCWLMGSDDIVLPGGIDSVINFKKEHEHIPGFSVNRQGMDKDCKKNIYERPVANGIYKENIKIKVTNSLSRWMSEYWGYLSGQIINRSMWLEVKKNEKSLEDYFNAYVHVYIIVKMYIKYNCWGYVHQKCVGWRSDNDSFLSGGILKRLAIDVFGYEKIAADTFGKESKYYKNWMSTISTVHVRTAIIGAKLNVVDGEFFHKAWLMCWEKYRKLPLFWVKTAPIFLMPAWLMKLARWFYRRTLRPLRLKKIAG